VVSDTTQEQNKALHLAPERQLKTLAHLTLFPTTYEARSDALRRMAQGNSKKVLLAGVAKFDLPQFKSDAL
jgi:hypothetical protein